MDNRITLKKEWDEIDALRNGMAGTILTKKVLITSAEFLKLKDTPILLMAKPGENKVIQILTVMIYMKYGSKKYTGGRDVYTYYEDRKGSLNSNYITSMSGNATYYNEQDSVSLSAARGQETSSETSGDIINKGIYLGMTANEATGDSSFEITLTYRIISL